MGKQSPPPDLIGTLVSIGVTLMLVALLIGGP
jgi:hypothetical protein